MICKKHRKLSTIYVDFHNADEKGYVRLNNNKTISDLKKANVVLRGGERYLFSDGELSIIGIVLKPGKEGVWRAKILWRALSEEFH